MRFTIRELFWLALVVALGVGGCFWQNRDTDEIQYFPPGPEFKKSQGASKDSLPNPSAPAQNLPSE